MRQARPVLHSSGWEEQGKLPIQRITTIYMKYALDSENSSYKILIIGYK